VLREAPPSGWWVDSFCEVASRLEGDTHHKPRHPSIPYKYDGPLWQYAKVVVGSALNKAMPTLDACNSWHSGAYLLETVPSVLYILESLAHEPEEAILCAINDTRDNDTIASIVGAAVGALHGASGLPERWRRDLLGRTRANDDGHVFDLIGSCCDVFFD